MKKEAQLLIIMAFILVVVSCKKDNKIEIVPGSTNVSTVSLDSKDAVKRIIKFKKQLSYYNANPDMKDVEKVSLSDALTDMENTFNATYSYTEDMYAETKTHELTLYIDVDTEGKVLLTDVTAFYNQMLSDVREAYANDDFSDKIFISLMIKSAEVSEGIAEVRINAITGERTNNNLPVPHVFGPFKAGDDYKYDYGTCDNPDVGHGAAYYIQQELRSLITTEFVEPSEGCRNIYVNRCEKDFIGNAYSGLFYRTDITDVCITWQYMNDYWYGEKKAIFVTIPGEDNFPGGEVIELMIIGDGTPYYITHRTRVEYADRVEVGIDEIGEIENLM